MKLSTLLQECISRNASDLHLVCDLPPMARIHGDIQTLPMSVLSDTDIESMIYEILTDEQKAKFENEWQLCFSLSMDNVGYFRVNIYYHRRRLEAAIRIGSLRAQQLEELGLPLILADLLRNTKGLLLITGPTGVGKTTTFNSIIDRINRERRAKIITVEDPLSMCIEISGLLLFNRKSSRMLNHLHPL